MIRAVLVAVACVVIILLVAVFIAAGIFPDVAYETALPYLLGIAAIGAVLGVGLDLRMSSRRRKK